MQPRPNTFGSTGSGESGSGESGQGAGWVESDGASPDPKLLGPKLLGPALEAARRALRQMDEEHVPAGIRVIAARSGKLPAPLARRLLRELEESEWLRAEAAEAWPAIDPENPDPKLRISALFLLRPSGWQEAAAGAQPERTGAAETSSNPKLTSELKKTRERIKKLENQLVLAQEAAGRTAELAESKLTLQAERFGKERQRRDLEVRQLELTLSDLRARLEKAEQAKKALSEDLDKLRKKQTPTVRSHPTPTRPVAWEPRDRLELARHLDDLMAARSVPPVPLSVESSGSIESSGGAPGALTVPIGLRPDRPEAIDWLLQQPQGIVVVIDGWNAAHLLASPPAAAHRDRVVEAGRRIRAASRGRRRVIVVFDSREGSEQISNADVEIIYVGSADEEILDMAARASSPLVAISTDRRVREGAESSGAVGLWSEALIDWLRLGGKRTFGS